MLDRKNGLKPRLEDHQTSVRRRILIDSAQDKEQSKDPGEQLSQDSRQSRMLRIFGNLPFFGVILFVFITTFPPVEVTTEVNLGIHMLQHIVIAISGVLIGYPLLKAGKLDRIKSPRVGIAGILVIAALLVFWHLPYFWDLAVQVLYVHFVEHLCFLFVGVLIGICVPMLPDNFKMIVLALTISAHMFYGFALFLISSQVYPLYSLSQQQTLGIAMFAPAPAYFVGYLYFTLTRENRRLEALESCYTTKQARRKPRSAMIVPILSITLIAVLVGYFAITGAVIATSNYQAGVNASHILIQETPVSWQYSPQNIEVVIGVNNTVVWTSHSFTYDTVTSGTGLFSSGAISPGGSFSFTFTEPGVYDYYCQYHLWMHGTIVVKSA
jgi:plastocyanin